MLEIGELWWDDGNLSHIEERGVDGYEVGEAVMGHHHAFVKGVDRLYVLGQTDAGRYLTIVLQPFGQGIWRPITARDCSRQEIRLLKKHTTRGQ